MIRAAIEHLEVHVCLGVLGEAKEKILQQLGLQISNLHHVDLLVIDQSRSASQIYRRHRQRLVHGLNEIAGAVDAPPLAQRLRKQIAQHNAGIFDRVVLVHIEIPPRAQLEIECAVLGKQLQHVIEEADSSRNLIASCSLNAQEPLNLGLFRIALNPGLSHALVREASSTRASSSFTSPMTVKAPNARSRPAISA